MKDAVEGVIAQGMQLAAGRTAQGYNQRKGRQGAFWEDRYHATAIEADEHLHRCLVYIDLNRVRAGVVRHPAEWAHSGYRQIQDPPERYALRELGLKARHCDVDEADGMCMLHEPRGAYASTFGTENSALRSENAILWTENPAIART